MIFIRNYCRALAGACLILIGAVGISPARAAMDLEAAVALAPYPLAEPTPDRVLIRNATVWTQSADGILKNTDILLENGKIAAIGTDLGAHDATAIDASGRHVTPGIIDAHSHSAIEDMGVNEGVNSVSAEVRIRDLLDPRSRQIYQQLAGGVTTIHVLHGSGNPIGGQNVIIKLRWGSPAPGDLILDGAPSTIKFALGENPKQSGFSAMGGEPRYPATRMGVAALIRSSFAQAAQYRDEWRAYAALSGRQQNRKAPPRRDLQLEALAEVLAGERDVHSHAYRADEILMLMRLADEIGFKVSTFHHVLEGYKVADEMAAHGAGGSTFSDWWSFKMEAFDAIPYNAAIMEQRSVLTSLNSDNADLARRLNLEAAKMLRYGGLEPADALAMVTINPARQLRIDDRIGSLEVGKDADLVVWSGDPLSVFSIAESTFVDGQMLFDRKSDLEHRERVVEAREMLAREIRGGEMKVSEAAEEAAGTNPPAPAVEYHFSPDAPAAAMAIVGATVHTLEGSAIPDGVVVFEAGRITAVGDAGTPVPASAERYDARGKHLWPGIIHTNTLLGISEIDTVAGSVDIAETGDTNADIDVSLAINAASTHFPVARSGGITHAVVTPHGGAVAGTNALVRTDGWTWEEMAAVRRHSLVLRWPDPIPARYAALMGPPKTASDLKKESEERLEFLDDLLVAAKAYGKAKQAAVDAGRVWEHDPQLEALQPVIEGQRPVWVSAREKSAIVAAVNWAVKNELRIVIMGGRDAYLVTDLLARHQIPVVLRNIVGEPPRDDDSYDVLYSLPARLEAAGVTFSIASGTFSGGSSNARNITLYAGIAAAHGLDREAAYRSITLYPARILGLDDALGSIAPGKSASFVLTDRDLLEPAANIEQVWIDGARPAMDDIQKAAFRKWGNRPRRETLE
jgi:imidazolonepropionase-like amidohydrolase